MRRGILPDWRMEQTKRGRVMVVGGRPLDTGIRPELECCKGENYSRVRSMPARRRPSWQVRSWKQSSVATTRPVGLVLIRRVPVRGRVAT